MSGKADRPFGIILAAGRGSRMGAMTDTQPKCLTQLAGKTLLQWQLSALQAAGVVDLCIVRGYQKQAIQADGVWYRDNPHWASSTMLRSLLCVQDLLASDETVVCYSDIVFHPGHVRSLLATGGDIRITYDISWKELWTRRFEFPLDDAETFVLSEGLLLEIGGKSADIDSIQGQYMGLTAITPQGWRQIQETLAHLTKSEQDRLDMTALFSLLLDNGVGITAVPVDGKWCEVDTEKDIAVYTKQLMTCRVWKHDWRWD